MTGTTNPYQMWLGLQVASRPDCYTLLGLPLYEADTGKILVATQNALSRASIPMSPADEPARQMLVAEIQTAQGCLLDPAQKQAYDQQLQAYYSGQSSPAATPAAAAPAATPVATPVTPGAASASSAAADSAAPVVSGAKKTAAGAFRQRARSSSRSFYGGAVVLLLLGAIGGGAYYYLQSNQPPEPIAQADPEPVSDVPPADEVPQPDAAPEEEERPNPRPRGPRPSAEDLANSIGGGLGNPDEAMNSMPENPGMTADPPKPRATPEQQRQLAAALEAAWGAVGQRDFGRASVHLEEVRPLPKTEEAEQRFAGLDQFVQDLMAFQRALNEGLPALQENEQLAVGSTTFTVNTNMDDRLVIRVAGQNKAYDKNDLPEGLKRAIAKSRLKGEDAQKKRIEASYLLLSQLADAEYIRTLWMQSGADADTLAALESGKQKYFPAATVAANMPLSTTPPPATEMTSTEEAEIPVVNAIPSTMPAGDATQRADQLGAALRQARSLLAERRVEQAMQTLEGAAPLAKVPEHQAKLERLQLLADLVQRFWTAVSARLGALEPDTELDVNGMLTRIVEASPDRLVIRLQGENRRYTLADIPAGLAKFLAEQQLGADSPETKRITGAFVLVSPQGGQEKALEDWNAAKQQGDDIEPLLMLLEDDYNLAEDLIEQMPVPAESEIAGPAAKFMENWSSKISDAKRVDDHAELGRQMHEAAQAQPDGSPQQFAAYRYALAESARGGDFATCTAIIDGWQTRFAIDEAEWHLKSLQLAASSSNAAPVHAALVKHALEQIPRLRQAGQTKVADAIQAIAEASAAKARDKALQDAVKQLTTAA